MYDMHYDLLTILYFNLMKNNKYANKQKLYSDLKKIYRNNILGGIINLYFMPPKEMKEELDISLEEMEHIKDMFEYSIKYLNKLKKDKIIPKNINFIYGIESCDYIQNEQDLENLYTLGLRSIIPVWNHQNQYGSGFRTNHRLTEKGEKLIKKALELGIIIDVSHANEKTFYDILEVYKENKREDSILIASHCNVKDLCDRKRNLSYEQLLAIKDNGGYIGLFTNGNFVSMNNSNLSYSERQNHFLKHIDYLLNEIKFDIDKIFISTDDMNFHPNDSYHHLEICPIENISNVLYHQLSTKYGKDVTNKILVENAEKVIHKVKKKTLS